MAMAPPHGGFRVSDSSNGSGGVSLGSSNRDSGTLPLPDDYFQTPALNNKETKYLINLAKRACKEVVFYSRRSGGPMQWVHLSSDDGVDVFQGIDESATASAAVVGGASSETKSMTYLRGATRIYATIDEIADFFQLDTPMKLSGFTQTVGKDVLDQKTLYDLALPTEENPKHYVGVKWSAIESPSKLARNRDFCYLECHDEFIDTNSKKRGWVRSVHSIRLPFCPVLTKSHGLVRGSLYRSGFVFLESSDRTYVDAVHTLHVDIKGNAPNWLKILVMKRRIKNISEVNRYFQLRRLCEGRLLGDLELPSTSGAAKCDVCSHRFGIFSRKTACRKCGKIVCGSCGHHFILDYAGVGAKKVRICTHCADHVVHGSDGNTSRGLVGAHRVDSAARPLYDQSPRTRSSSVRIAPSRLNRQPSQSNEEREYYERNDDAEGLAAMEDAKRMNREYQDHVARTAALPLDGTIPSPAAVGGMPPKASRRPSAHRTVTYDSFIGNVADDPIPPRSRMFQEYLQHERLRQKSIGTPVVDTPPHNRKSILRAGGAPAPGELLSRTRQNGQGRFSSNSTELEFQLSPPPPPPPASPHVHSPPKVHFDTIRSGSEYEPDFDYPMSRLHERYSDEMTVGAPIRRSDLSVRRSDLSAGGRMSRQSSLDTLQALVAEKERVPDHVFHRGNPSPSRAAPAMYASPTSTNSFSHGPSSLMYRQRPSPHHQSSRQQLHEDSEFEQFKRNYFDARNSGMDQLQERLQSQPADKLPDISDSQVDGDFRYGYDATTVGSDDTDFQDREYEVPMSAESIARLSSRRAVSDEAEIPGVTATTTREPVADMATVMALSAMKLYEKENGLGAEISEETRQAALKKMIEIYSSELERNHRHAGAGDHQNRSGGRMGHRRASLSTTQSNTIAPGHHRINRQYAQTEMAYTPDSTEYRDLSDLSASAFRAYQKESHEDRRSSQPRSDAEPSLPSTGPGDSAHRRQRGGTDDMSRADATATHRGSLPNSEGGLALKLRSPVRDDVSDTFSELDLIDLPHLMRADAEGATNPTSTNDRRSSLERLSHDSHQTTFSEISGGRVSSIIDPTQPSPRMSEPNQNHTRSSYSSLHAEPGLHSPLSKVQQPQHRDSLSSRSDDRDVDGVGNTTNRTKMTQSELERYRASLAQIMAEYNTDHNSSLGITQLLQPDREREPNARVKGTNPTAAQPEHDHVLQELYL